MSADPRVEAVADALSWHREQDGPYEGIWRNYACTCGWWSPVDTLPVLMDHLAAVAVAELDAYDRIARAVGRQS